MLKPTLVSSLQPNQRPSVQEISKVNTAMSKLIPTALERQKIFYHLKKCSSYTAWSRVLGYYKTWADIFEKSVVEAAIYFSASRSKSEGRSTN